ncbi:hypothetical protein CDAR_544711 [Caerostris darwini]|uniref:Uncharacterized protein n=1 Tax=Caerostris darwini TaxID=1538125 RepID=A0AAV4TTD7_9ARAC|nr:hypothetical protein CDAR_544711 [Caerostris darwini]
MPWCTLSPYLGPSEDIYPTGNRVSIEFVRDKLLSLRHCVLLMYSTNSKPQGEKKRTLLFVTNIVFPLCHQKAKKRDIAICVIYRAQLVYTTHSPPEGNERRALLFVTYIIFPPTNEANKLISIQKRIPLYPLLGADRAFIFRHPLRALGHSSLLYLGPSGDIYPTGNRVSVEILRDKLRSAHTIQKFFREKPLPSPEKRILSGGGGVIELEAEISAPGGTKPSRNIIMILFSRRTVVSQRR